MSKAGDSLQWAGIMYCLEGMKPYEKRGPEKNRKPNVVPLVELLRGVDPISDDIRKLLADLFDPKKPIGVYAEIKFSRLGRQPTTLWDYDLYSHCEALKFENGWKKISETEWAKIAKEFGITENPPFATTKGAYARGKRIAEEQSRIRAEQE
jgi:hypothetical protein